MKFRTFALFVGPSVLLMFLFIATPLISVLWQSFHLTKPVFENVEVETCTPSFTGQTCVTENKTRPKLNAEGRIIEETQFVGLQSYRSLIEPQKTLTALSSGNWSQIQNIDFWNLGFR